MASAHLLKKKGFFLSPRKNQTKESTCNKSFFLWITIWKQDMDIIQKAYFIAMTLYYELNFFIVSWTEYPLSTYRSSNTHPPRHIPAIASC